MIEYRQTPSAGDAGSAFGLARELALSPQIAELLCRRGCDTPEAAREFLNPSIERLHDPFLFNGMQDAVDCIFAALANDELFCVYGDYDVDGVMAVTILVRQLKSMGARVVPYIPSRHTEGYGLNTAAVESLAKQGVTTLITVDCGITALKEIARAYELGMEVVVTDHHQCLPELPECAAVIDPADPAERYPYKNLCGAGVAFKLAHALGGREAALRCIDCAAIATLADIVPLTGENREIVAEGLRRINAGHCLAGVRAMIEASGFSGRQIEAETVSFSIAPRINAAGRTGSVQTALDLFLTDDWKTALPLAAELDAENKHRQAIEAQIFADARQKIAAGEADVVRDSAILLVGEGWNHGVIGIVASRLVERYAKPVILFTAEDGVCVGSGRSVKGVHLFQALNSMPELFERFGGHEMAAGLTIKQEKMPEFARRFQAYLAENVPQEAFVPRAVYDMELSPKDMTLPLAEALRALAPFGMGNPSPIFRLRDVRPINPVAMGAENRHLRFSLARSRNLRDALPCVAYSMGGRQEEMSTAREDLLCSLEINDWRGERKAQAVVRQARAVLPEDPLTFLEENEAKFYDAFFEGIRYNKNWFLEGSNAKISPDWPERFAAWLAASPQGAVAVCATPQGARRFVAEMREKGVLEKLDVIVGEYQDDRAYNAVLLAPRPRAIPAFRRVLVMDALPAGLMELFTQNAAEEVLFANEPDGGFYESARLTREELIPVYTAMAGLAGRQTTFTSRRAYLRELKKCCSASDCALLLGVYVFEELGFFEIKEKGAFCVTPQRVTKKRELMESTTYQALWDRGAEAQ